MKTQIFREYKNQKIAVVMEGKNNPTYFGELIEIDEGGHTICLKHSRDVADTRLQTKQIVAISAYIPKAVTLSPEDEE